MSYYNLKSFDDKFTIQLFLQRKNYWIATFFMAIVLGLIALFLGNYFKTQVAFFAFTIGMIMASLYKYFVQSDTAFEFNKKEKMLYKVIPY